MPADNFGSVVVIGPPYSGKTALIQHVLSQSALEGYEPTLGVMPHRLQGKVGDKDVSCTMWDTGGDTRNRNLCRAYYTTAAVVVIVVDVTRRQSILEARLFYNEVVTHTQRDATIILVGNKSDLDKEQYQDDLVRLSEEWHISCYLVSVKNEKQVQTLFAAVLSEVCAKSNQRKSMALRSAESKRKEVFGSKIDRSARFKVVDSKPEETQNTVDHQSTTMTEVIAPSPNSYLKQHGWKILLGALVVSSLLFGILAISGGLGALSLVITSAVVISQAGADALLTVITLLLGAGIGAGVGAIFARYHQNDKKVDVINTEKPKELASTQAITQTLERNNSKVKAAAAVYEANLQAQVKPEPDISVAASEGRHTTGARIGRH